MSLSASGSAAPGKAKTMKRGKLYHHPYNKVAKVKGPASCSWQKTVRSWQKIVYSSGQPKTSLGEKRKFGEDRISKLPMDILGAILSLLTFQEAGRTSVLSRNWRYKWALLTSRLNFDTWKSVQIIGFGDITFGGRKINSATFVSRVNEVLKLHQGAFVDEFVIRFHLEGGYSHDIDNWANFAFQKAVKRFELDLAVRPFELSNLELVRNGYRKPWYDFPSVEKLFLIVCPSVFWPLRTLCLGFVNVTGEVVEHFLGNCPLLEQLQVIYSDSLTNLKVVGSSLKLKCLEISKCYYMKELEISAANLVSLTYFGPVIRLLLKNVPMLSVFCTRYLYGESVIHKTMDHLSYLRQLESLKLILPSNFVKRYLTFPLAFPELCCLKQLEMELVKARGEDLIFYTSLVKACPSLSKYTVRYAPGPLCDDVTLALVRRNGRDARVAPKFLHQCLKVVELVGFEGHADELEFILQLLVIAVSLEKLNINPHSPLIVKLGLQSEGDGFTNVQIARKRAWSLGKKVPSKVKVVVI